MIRLNSDLLKSGIKKSKKICKRIPDALDAVCLSVGSVIIVGVALFVRNRRLRKKEEKKNGRHI